MSTARMWLLATNIFSLAAIIMLGYPHSSYFCVFSFFATAGVCALKDLDRRLPAAPAPKEPPDADPEFESVVDAVWGPVRKGRPPA